MGQIKKIKAEIERIEIKIHEAREPLRLAQLEMAHQLNAWHTGKVSTKEATVSAEMAVQPLSEKLSRLIGELKAAQASLEKSVKELDKKP